MSKEWGNAEEYEIAQKIFDEYTSLDESTPDLEKIDKAILCIKAQLKAGNCFYESTGFYASGPEPELKRLRSDASFLCAQKGMIDMPPLPAYIPEKSIIGLQDLLTWFSEVKKLLTVNTDKKKVQKRKRSTKKDVTKMNSIIISVAAVFEAHHGRLPTVDEIADQTEYEPKKIYNSNAYKDGKIAKKSARATEEMVGKSVIQTDYYTPTSNEASRATRRTKSDQDELDALIDEQEEDDKSDYIK